MLHSAWLLNVIKMAYYLQQPACWQHTNKAVVACFADGESLSTGENNYKLIWNMQNRKDMAKYKCRYIGLPDVMGFPNIQAAPGDVSTGTTFLVHCVITSQTLTLTP